MKEDEKNVDNYKGLQLFNDIEDFDLRTHNRAIVLANLFEEAPVSSTGVETEKVSERSALLAVGYFGQIPNLERKAVHEALKAELLKRIANVK